MAAGHPHDGVVELPSPDVRSVGRLRGLWRTYRYRKKLARKAANGYVCWYLVDGSWPTPKFVKPEVDDGSIPEVEYDGGKYLFPRDALLSDSTTGMWIAVHRKGEADPINLREPNQLAIPAKSLKDYVEMGVTAEEPGGLFGSFDLSGEQIVGLLLVIVVVYALMMELFGGGLPI